MFDALPQRQRALRHRNTKFSAAQRSALRRQRGDTHQGGCVELEQLHTMTASAASVIRERALGAAARGVSSA